MQLYSLFVKIPAYTDKQLIYTSPLIEDVAKINKIVIQMSYLPGAKGQAMLHIVTPSTPKKIKQLLLEGFNNPLCIK